VPERVLITGFEPFGGDGVNPSGRLALALSGRTIAGRIVEGRVLPVDSARVGGLVRAAVAETQPAMILLTGLAPGRAGLAIESGASNVLDFDQPDNAGRFLRNCRIAEHGAERLVTNLPVGDVLAAWQKAGISGVLSDSAGTYLCNQAFYEVLALNERSIPTGFIHLPDTPELAATRAGDRRPALEFERMIEAIELCVEVTFGRHASA